MNLDNEVQKTPQEIWSAEIAAAEKELKKFHERAEGVNRRFLDERDTISSESKWFNIYYANTNILESALYSQIPKPIVSRKYKDYQDQVARVASQMLERCITQDLDDPNDTFDATMRHCVQDRLVPGLSQAWLRLETDTKAIELDIEPQPGMEAEDEPETMQSITDQRVCVDYVYWKDFLWSPCRVWQERRWVGRKVYMSRKELVKRWPDKGAKIPLDYSTVGSDLKDGGKSSTPKDDTVKKACIYELWVRDGKKVIWLSKGMNEIIEEADDPLKLVGFEPCPTPMLANVTTSNTTPRPDYYMIQDQYNELDVVNNRISLLIKACKVVGVYDKSAGGVARMLKEGFDNDLIPVDNWAMFAEKGGIKGQVDWFPLEVVVAALQQLNLAREAIKAQIYELTGISDIVRGASKASETLGAQEIKAKFASVRIKKLQDEVARFASEILRIKAEIMVKHFDPEILVKKSNLQATEDAPLLPQAIDMLKTPEGFEWRIEVTGDSIAQADYDMEKRDRVEFLTAVSSYLEKASVMFQAVPQSATLLVGMLKWAVAGFRNASEIEGMIDKELDNLTKNPPEDKPDPEAAKAQAEQQKMQQEAQLEQQKMQAELQAEQQKNAMEQQKMQMEFLMEQQRLQIELMAEKQRLAMEQQAMQMKMMFEQAMNTMKLNAAQAMGQQKIEQGAQQAEAKMATDAAMSEQKITQAKAEAKAAPKKGPAK